MSEWCPDCGGAEVRCQTCDSKGWMNARDWERLADELAAEEWVTGTAADDAASDPWAVAVGTYTEPEF